MNQKEEVLKRENLKSLLFDLAKSQEILKNDSEKAEIYKRLENIYYSYDSDNFRHYYSDIFSTVSVIYGDSGYGSLDILAENIQGIVDGYEPKNADEYGNLIDIHKELFKLYDHTNLEIARINYTNTINGQTKSELAKTKLMVDDLKSEMKSGQEKITAISEENIDAIKNLSNELNTNQKEMQKDYVAILGIFASIILAFTGAFAFSDSLLENMGNSSIYRLMIVASIIGIVFFNLIWVLIDFIKEICFKDLKKNRVWMFWTINAFFIIVIIITLVACLFTSTAM